MCPEDHGSCNVGAWATWKGQSLLPGEVRFYLQQGWGRRGVETQNGMCWQQVQQPGHDGNTNGEGGSVGVETGEVGLGVTGGSSSS